MFWLLIGLLLAIFCWYNYKKFSYWSNKGVEQKIVSMLLDIYQMLFMKKTYAEYLQDKYNEFPNSRYSGTYQFYTPLLILKDAELIKQITVKNFEHFSDHMNFIPEDVEPLWTSNLFILKGDKWREMRSIISPAFTGSKMRAMFTLMSESAQEISTYFESHPDECKSIEMKDLFTRYANDVLATFIFGVQCNSIKQRNNEFYLMGKLMTDFTSVWKTLRLIIQFLLPKLSKVLGISFFSKSVSKYFRHIVDMRQENNIIQPDVINLLMEARKSRFNLLKIKSATEITTDEELEIANTVKTLKDAITDDDITANALLLFFAGFDTVTTVMVLMAYELSVNPDIQKKLQHEIDAVLEENAGKITYETINKMKYLHMVTSEALRKWPSINGIDRICVKPYTIAPVLPNEIPLTLKVGDIISVPVYGIHRDPKYYPNPEKFDPERFSDENIDKIKTCTYLPFGSGPRSCIGSRFALQEIKVIYVHLLAKFNIIITEKSEIPVKLSKTGFSFNSKNGFWFALKLRD